jgi:hypothetical protein
MTATLAGVANDDIRADTRLVEALRRHGFDATLEDAGFCDGDVSAPCIRVFKFRGEGEHTRLTELVLEFYESTEVPRFDRDTQLRVNAFDKTVDGELEFDYELSFDGLETLVLMPREIFEIHPDSKRSIEERYFAKIERFADFLENRDP